jgi:uncharacterized protein
MVPPGIVISSGRSSVPPARRRNAPKVWARHTAYDGVVDDEPIDVRDNPEAERYEAIVDGRLAGYVAYRARPGALALTHTDVLPRWEGRGIGGRLARAALDDARARGLKALPYCPFIAAWIRRHPEYEDLVPEEELGLLDRRR